MKLKIKYREENKKYLDFLEDIKEGVYTSEKPGVVRYKLQRIEIQEQDDYFDLEDIQEEGLLFGITS